MDLSTRIVVRHAHDGEATMPHASAEGGRGISIINALVDALTYERDGEINRWTMRRSFEG